MTIRELKFYLEKLPDDLNIKYEDGISQNLDIELIKLNNNKIILSPRNYKMTDQEVVNNNLFELLNYLGKNEHTY